MPAFNHSDLRRIEELYLDNIDDPYGVYEEEVEVIDATSKEKEAETYPTGATAENRG